MRVSTTQMAQHSDPYKELSDKDDSKMVLASKDGDWETVWTILDKKPYLMNSIPKERAWAVLHQAVWWNDQKAVEKILNIPGCDSELLTKNGLKPLDIDTTGEIKKLLENHIKSSKLSKTSIFSDAGNLVDEDIPKMVLASKKGQWDTVCGVLDKQPYLVNTTPKEMDWGILHHAVLRKDINAVKMILKIPGCDAEMLSNNGMRPLDIDTTPEIKELLTDYITSNEPSKASFFLTPEDIATPLDGIYPKQLSDDKLIENDTPIVEELSAAYRNQDQRKFFRIFNFWGHLINVINPETGMAPIHEQGWLPSIYEAALAGDEKVITELMSYQACNMDIKTKEPASVGAGKTAIQNSKSEHVTKQILCRLEEEKKKYNNQVPTCVDIQFAQLNLMYYVQGAMENYKICEKIYNQNYFRSFPAMEERIFNFINTGDNWITVRDIVADEIGIINASERTIISRIQNKTVFFTYLIQLYTKNNYYPALYKQLRSHPLELPDVRTEIQNNQKSYRVYTALTNAVLFHANLPKLGKRSGEKTYRGADLSAGDLDKYRVGNKFAWMSFTSSSSVKEKAFPGNCRFTFNNEMKCPWSPRGIESISVWPNKHEYLYPCGAHFEVTKLKQKNGRNIIYLKLISSPMVSHIKLVYEKEKLHYDTLVAQYNRIYSPVFEKKKLLDTLSVELNALHLRVEIFNKFENEVVENRSRRIDLPKGTKSYHCRDCNTTCDYPCPEPHMSSRKCEICIPTAEGACIKCQGRCHFTKHSRVEYRIEIEQVTTTVIDEAMKREHAAAVAEFQSKDNEYKTMKGSWERDFARLPKGTQLIEDMQISIREQTNILSVEESETWEDYNDILMQLIERRRFVEECRYKLSEWKLL